MQREKLITKSALLTFFFFDFVFISKRYISITVFPSRAALKPISHAQHDWFAKKTETHFSLCILVKRKTLHFTHDAFVCRKGANWFDAVLRCTVGILLCLHWILFTNGKQIKRKINLLVEWICSDVLIRRMKSFGEDETISMRFETQCIRLPSCNGPVRIWCAIVCRSTYKIHYSRWF